MVYPALTDLETFALVLAVGILSTYVFSKALKLKPQMPTFAAKRQQVVLSFAVFVAIFAGAFGIYGFYDRVWVRTTLTADPLYVLRDLIAIGILLLPVVLALKFSRQNSADVALTRKNLSKSLALGLLTSIVMIVVFAVVSPSLAGGYAGVSIATGYLLLSYFVIAVGEEIAFRGYIQSRLVNFSGSTVGVGVTSLLYALYNVPLGFFCYGGDWSLALVYGLWRFSSGLVYGYVFHRSQNVASSIVVHMFLVWGGLLFSLYL